MPSNEFTVGRDGLKRWKRPPEGYVYLTADDRVRGLDVQRLGVNLYAEYPENGMLVGHFRGVGGVWLRRSEKPAI